MMRAFSRATVVGPSSRRVNRVHGTFIRMGALEADTAERPTRLKAIGSMARVEQVGPQTEISEGTNPR